MEFDYKILNLSLFHQPKLAAYFSILDQGSIKSGFYTHLERFSKESFEEGVNELLKVLKNFSSLSTASHEKNLLPSVRFFLLSLSNSHKDIRAQSAGLVFQPTIEKIENFQQLGFTTLKLKFQRFDEETKSLLKTIFSNFLTIKFRLDFNRHLSKDEIIDLLNFLPLDMIDYIEEPGPDLLKIIDQYPPIFAFDESLRLDANFPLDLDATYVIKPCLMQNFESFIDALKINKKRIIISSSFELQSGLDYLHRLVFKYGLESDCHGLDTLRYYDSLPSL